MTLTYISHKNASLIRNIIKNILQDKREYKRNII